MGTPEFVVTMSSLSDGFVRWFPVIVFGVFGFGPVLFFVCWSAIKALTHSPRRALPTDPGHPNQKRLAEAGITASLDSLVLVRADLLKLGDVVLSRGRFDESNIIAWATRGRFSHAALIVNPMEVFEADDSGAGVGAPVSVLALVSGVSERWIGFECQERQLTVLRHPELAQKPAADLRENLCDFWKRYRDLYYASADRLANPLRLPWPFGAITAIVLRRKLRESRPFGSGVFCSELVASFYRDNGLPLFAGRSRLSDWLARRWRPDQISPNDLSRSVLTPVDDVIVQPDSVRSSHFQIVSNLTYSEKNCCPSLWFKKTFLTLIQCAKRKPNQRQSSWEIHVRRTCSGSHG